MCVCMWFLLLSLLPSESVSLCCKSFYFPPCFSVFLFCPVPGVSAIHPRRLSFVVLTWMLQRREKTRLPSTPSLSPSLSCHTQQASRTDSEKAHFVSEDNAGGGSWDGHEAESSSLPDSSPWSLSSGLAFFSY